MKLPFIVYGPDLDAEKQKQDREFNRSCSAASTDKGFMLLDNIDRQAVVRPKGSHRNLLRDLHGNVRK